jgi:small basic protein
MWIVIGLCVGVFIGLILPSDLYPPTVYSKYISISFLAGIDSVLGAVRAGMEGKFKVNIFVSGFFSNALLAALLTWIGDKLGVDLYLAAVVTFGVRVFDNLAYIRRDIMEGRNGSQESAADKS